MYLSVYLPLLFSALFGLTAPPLARQLPPAPSTWLLSGGALLAASASTASLALLGFTLLGQTPLVAERGGWSNDALQDINPVPAPVAALALAALVLLAAYTARIAIRRLRALRDAYRLARALPSPAGELVVTRQETADAYAVPGWPGRIVVSTGLLRRLDADERRAVLAHERSHLAHHHHLHQTVAQLAAAANPLLLLIPAAVRLSCERWADEDAAAGCRRDTVATALTRAATGRNDATAAGAVMLAAAVADVARRVRALAAPPPRLIRWRVALLLGLLAATALTVAEAAHDTQRLFEFAEAAYGIGRH